MCLTAGTILLFCGGVAALHFSIKAAGAANSAHWLGVLSPTVTLISATETTYRTAPAQFWSNLDLCHLLAWLMIALASFVLPRRWQERPRRWEAATFAPPLTGMPTEPSPASFVLTRRDPELLNEDPIVVADR